MKSQISDYRAATGPGQAIGLAIGLAIELVLGLVGADS